MKFNDNYIPELGKSAAVDNLVIGVANKAAAIVRSTAPVDSGEYVDNVRVEVLHTANRVVAKVVADVEHAMVVESKHGTLARALRQVSTGG